MLPKIFYRLGIIIEKNSRSVSYRVSGVSQGISPITGRLSEIHQFFNYQAISSGWNLWVIDNAGNQLFLSAFLSSFSYINKGHAERRFQSFAKEPPGDHASSNIPRDKLH